MCNILSLFHFSLFPYLYFQSYKLLFCSIAEALTENKNNAFSCLQQRIEGRRSYYICYCQSDSVGNNIASKLVGFGLPHHMRQC